jgi:hypothetical protein
MSPTTGTFASVDPSPGSSYAPATLGRYVYAGASPLSSYDPSGQNYFTIAAVAVVGVVAVTLATHAIVTWAHREPNNFIFYVANGESGLRQDFLPQYGVGKIVNFPGTEYSPDVEWAMMDSLKYNYRVKMVSTPGALRSLVEGQHYNAIVTHAGLDRIGIGYLGNEGDPALQWNPAGDVSFRDLAVWAAHSRHTYVAGCSGMAPGVVPPGGDQNLSRYVSTEWSETKEGTNFHKLIPAAKDFLRLHRWF